MASIFIHLSKMETKMISNFYKNSIPAVRKFTKNVCMICTVLIACFGFIANPTQAQTSAAISVFGGGAVLGDVINQLRSSVYSTITNAEISADSQIAHAANEAMMLLREMEIAFAEQLDDTLDDVDTQVLTTVETVYAMERALEDGTAELIYAIDGATLDIERIVGNTIFADYPFLMKRIVGMTHLFNSDGEYVYELRGSGFGNSSVMLEAFTVDGTALIDKARINQTAQNVVRVSFDVATLNEFFDTSEELAARKIRILPVSLIFTRTSKRPWYLFFLDNKVETLEHSFYTYLLPNYAGTLRLTNFGESFAWERIDNFEFTHRSVHNHCNEDCDDQKSFPCGAFFCSNSSKQCVAQRPANPLREGDERLFAPGHGGGGSHHRNHKVEIHDGGACLWFSVESNSHSHAFRVFAQRERYTKQPDPVITQAENLPVEFGKTYPISVPPGTIVTNFEIDPIGSAKVQTGQLTQGVNSEVLRVISSEKIGESTIHNVTIHYPDLN